MPPKPQALTPEEEFRRKAILDELASRKRHGKAEAYTPNRKGEGETCPRCGRKKSSQYQFHKSTKKHRLIHAGDRAGKTEAATMEFIWHCLGTHPLKATNPPYKFRVCGDGMTDQVEQVLVEKYHELVPTRFLDGGSWASAYSKSSHTLDINDNKGHTSRIGFVSYDQDPGKLAGKDLDGVHHDEPSPRSFWKENRSRLMDRDGFAMFTFTPRHDMQALWEFEMYEKAMQGDSDYEVFNFHTEDNPYLNAEAVAKMIEELGQDDPQTLKMRLCGDFCSIGGIIYASLDRRFHVKHDFEVCMSEDWPRFVCIDPGVAKEHAVLWGAVGPGNRKHFYRELAQDGEIKDLCSSIRRLSGLEFIQHYFIDGHWDWDNRTAKGSDNQSLNLEREFILNGMPVQKAPLDIRMWLGIDQVRAHLKQRRPVMIEGEVKILPDITFSPECERTWYEMTHYSQIPPKRDDPTRHSPKIRKVDDDFCDCVRIGITSNPTYIGASGVNLFSQAEPDEYGIVF